MKRVAIVALLIASYAVPAAAEQIKNSIGINYAPNENGIWGFQGEFDVSSKFNNAPVSFQLFWKSYTKHYYVSGTGDYKYTYNGLGAAFVYDFSSMLNTGKKIKPYAGLGYMTLNAAHDGPDRNFPVADKRGGLYATGGIRYAFTKRFSGDVSVNNFGYPTFGFLIILN